jgi:hypothetical protein
MYNLRKGTFGEGWDRYEQYYHYYEDEKNE